MDRDDIWKMSELLLKLLSLRDYAKGHCEEFQDIQRDRHVSHPRLSANGMEVSSEGEGLGLSPHGSRSRKGQEKNGGPRSSVEEEK